MVSILSGKYLNVGMILSRIFTPLRRYQVWMMAGLLAVVSLVVFWPCTNCLFLNYDDNVYVTANGRVVQGMTLENLEWYFFNFYYSNWHPLTMWSYMLDRELWGMNPRGFHLTNIVFHALNTALLFLVLWKIIRGRNAEQPNLNFGSEAGMFWGCSAVAALFALHPGHVESVAWISERKDVLSGFFMLLSLWAYVSYVQTADAYPEDHASLSPADDKASARHTTFISLHLRYYVLAICLFALGLMSKPMLVTLPVILLLLDLGFFKRVPAWHGKALLGSLKPLIAEKIPLFLLSGVSALLTIQAQGQEYAIVGVDKLPLLERLANVPVFVVDYLGKLIWPARLAVYYPYPQISPWEQLCAGGLVLLVSVFCCWCWRSRPLLLVGWFWFLIMLLPVIGIIQVGGQSIADRYLYLPSVGFFIAVIFGWGELVHKGATVWRIYMACVLGLLLVACAVLTRTQIKYWRTSVALHQHSLDIALQKNPVSQFELACAYWLEEGNLEKAAILFEKTIEDRENTAWRLSVGSFYNNLGCVLLRIGDPTNAAAQFKAAILADQGQSQCAQFHKNLGDALMYAGLPEEAQIEFVCAEQLAPQDMNLRQTIALSRNLMGLRGAAGTNADFEALARMAGVEAALELDRNAFKHYQEALKLNPQSPEILNNLAWLLTSSRDAKVRNGALAVQYARQACDLTGYQSITCVGTLAAAHAEARQFDEAVALAQKACALAAEQGEYDLLKRNSELLKGYKARHAYRDR